MAYRRTGRIIRVKRECRSIARPALKRQLLCKYVGADLVIPPSGWELAVTLSDAEALARARIRSRHRDAPGQRLLFLDEGDAAL